jgi:pimeloyl-ACP methyl ester carboxylesterase
MSVRIFCWFFLVPVFLSACADSRVDVASANTDRFEEFHAETEDGAQLYGRILGTGPDTVIITPAVYLARDLEPLSAGRTLIFYDPRSRGGSDHISDPQRLGIGFEVSDIGAVRAHFGINRFSVIGWSYLGAVVGLYAADFPEHVKSVVQIGPMAPRPETATVEDQRGSPATPEDLEYLARLEQDGMPATDPVGYCREWARIQMIQPMMARPEAASRSGMDPCIYWNEWPAQVFSTLGRVVPPLRGEAWDYTEEAARIQAPVLTIHGTDDPNAPVEGGRDWADFIPGATLLELEGIGHAPWLESSDEFFRAVDDFLSEHGP